MTDAEAVMLRRFVASPKRERLLTLLEAGPRRRHDLCAQLAHLGSLDPRWLQPLPLDSHTVDQIVTHLRRLGAGATCQAICENPDLDGKTLTLEAALQLVLGFGYGTLLIIKPGELGYFEGEEINDRYVLCRPRA